MAAGRDPQVPLGGGQCQPGEIKAGNTFAEKTHEQMASSLVLHYWAFIVQAGMGFVDLFAPIENMPKVIVDTVYCVQIQRHTQQIDRFISVTDFF